MIDVTKEGWVYLLNLTGVANQTDKIRYMTVTCSLAYLIYSRKIVCKLVWRFWFFYAQRAAVYVCYVRVCLRVHFKRTAVQH